MNAPQFPERWVRCYTRGLPQETRDARRAEIASDVYEQCGSANGSSARALRMAVVGRTVRGLPGDFMWRIEEGRTMKQQQRAAIGRPSGLQAAWATATQAWFTPVAVLIGIFDLLAAVFVIADPDGKMPGQAIGPVILVGFGISMFVGLWLRWRAQFDRTTVNERVRRSRPVSSTSMLIGLAFLGVVFIALGAMTTPLAAVVGACFLIVAVGVAAAGLRRGTRPADEVQRAERAGTRSPWIADGLIVAGTLPAIGLWWMVVPPILALVVIGGVIGTQPGTRSHAAA